MNWIARQDARHRLVLSLVLAASVWFALKGHAHFWTQSIATWDAFAVCVLAFAWLTILTTSLDQLRLRAQTQDVSRKVIFMFVVAAACASFFAVGFLLYRTKGQSEHFPLHLSLSFLAVVSSWALVHTVFGLRYAHMFYGDSDDPLAQQHAGGLVFPDEDSPNYMDFVYFSFVIGMTFQVSDVQITSREIRRIVLLHGALSFGFSTIILALTINTISTLL